MTLSQFAIARVWAQLKKAGEERPLTEEERGLKAMLTPDIARFAKAEQPAPHGLVHRTIKTVVR